MGNKEIEFKKGKLINPDYIEKQKREAITLMKFRFPECEIELDENEERVLVKAVSRKKPIEKEGDER